MSVETSKKNISILGSGWLGKPLGVHFTTKGYAVNISTRSSLKAAQLASDGLQSFSIDIEDLSNESSTFLAADILIIAVTSKSITGYQRLIDQIKGSSVSKVLFISSTSVYKATNKIVTETASTDEENPLVKIENLFLNNPSFHTTIIRFGGLFGYARKPGNFFRGEKIVKDPDAYVNMIHRDDCIQIIDRIIEQGVWGTIFNACADTHPTKREFYTKASVLIGTEPPRFEQESESCYKIVSNEKVKKSLGVQFLHNDLLNIPDE